jgi:hypothetical protein
MNNRAEGMVSEPDPWLHRGARPTTTDAAFGGVKNDYRLAARSRTALAHVPVGLPLLAAASSYAFLRRLERRNSSLSSSGSSMGGLPRGRFG